MDVTDQFQQVSIFLAQNGFVAVLKQVTVPPVSQVKGNRIAGQKPEHYFRYRYLSGFKQQVKMVGDQGPRETSGFGFFDNMSQPFNKIIAVDGILKDCPTFDAAANDVMQGSGGVYACFSGHAGKVTC
jgi:hypothetical protein